MTSIVGACQTERMDDLLKLEAAAEYVGKSGRTLWRLIKNNKLGVTYRTETGADGRPRDVAFISRADLDELRASESVQRVRPAVVNDVMPRNDIALVTTSNDAMTQPDTVTLAALVALSASGSNPLWLSIKEAAALSGLPQSDIRRAIQSGVLASLRTGRGVRLRRDVVLQWAMSPTVRVPIVNAPRGRAQ